MSSTRSRQKQEREKIRMSISKGRRSGISRGMKSIVAIGMKRRNSQISRGRRNSMKRNSSRIIRTGTGKGAGKEGRVEAG